MPAALTAARHLGLLHTVTVALQALHKHAELQLQEHSSIVAEFDRVSSEHARDCFTAWSDQADAESFLQRQPGHPEAVQTRAASSSDEGDRAIAGLPVWDLEAQRQQRELTQQLVAELRQGELLPPSHCSIRATCGNACSEPVKIQISTCPQ